MHLHRIAEICIGFTDFAVIACYFGLLGTKILKPMLPKHQYVQNFWQVESKL